MPDRLMRARSVFGTCSLSLIMPVLHTSEKRRVNHKTVSSFGEACRAGATSQGKTLLNPLTCTTSQLI